MIDYVVANIASIYCRECGQWPCYRVSLMRHVEARHPEKHHLEEDGNKTFIDPQNDEK